MNLALHILKKDLRHCWKQTGLALALLAIYVWNERTLWMPPSASSDARSVLSNVLGVALFLSWLLMIARLIQDEALAGERQFWLTRPYERKKLLAAKLLFVAVTVNLPLFVAQMVMLALAGFAPWRYLPGLLWMQLTLTVLFLLPVVAMAAITANLPQMLVAALWIGVNVALLASLRWMAPGAEIWMIADPRRWLIPGLIAAGCVAVIVRQYAKRNTIWGRWVLQGVVLAVFLLWLVTPYRWLVEREYPLIAGEEPPLRMALSSTMVPFSEFSQGLNLVEINLPVLFTPAPLEHTFVKLDGWMLTIVAPDGRQWNSGWEFGDGKAVFNRRGTWWPAFGVDRKFFERVRSVPVKVRLAIAFTTVREDRDRDVTRMARPGGELSVPGVGICRIAASDKQVLCRAPFFTPSAMEMAAPLQSVLCSGSQVPAGHSWWVGHYNSTPAGNGISPVRTFAMPMHNRDKEGNPQRCGEIPFSFIFPRIQDHGRVEIAVENVRLGN
jgi:hypothetical protein